MSAVELATAAAARAERPDMRRCTAYATASASERPEPDDPGVLEVEAGQLHRATTCLATVPAPTSVAVSRGPNSPG